ncbi:hypothetical protein BHE17_03585 [Planococcus maritimus]|nr:hypothetical protein BHE17_03585 [Planococcus maritimus]
MLHDEKINAVCTSLKCLTKRLHQRMPPVNRDTNPYAIFNKISKPNRAHGRAGAMRQAFFLAYCGRHAQSGRRLLHDEKINAVCTSLKCLTKRLHQQMPPVNRDTNPYAIFNEISKPNRAHGRAVAMRQAFFLAHCGRHAQSGRRLLHDEKINAVCTSLKCLTKRLHQRMPPVNSDTSSHAVLFNDI